MNFVRHKKKKQKKKKKKKKKKNGPLYNLKTFKMSSRNFIWLSINIRRCVERKKHNSCIYKFWVISLGISLVNINVRWMYNMTPKRGETSMFL